MKRVAVIGFGFMGMTHTLNILKNENLKLSAIIDVNPTLIEQNLSTKSGNISTGNVSMKDLENITKSSNFDSCLSTNDLNAVFICTHTHQHYEMTKKALLNDKHVFLEKPLCLDIKQGEELITIAKQRGKILMIGHVVRFMPPYQKLKQWIDSNEFGELRFLSFTRFSGLPVWGQWKDKKVSESSGGALFDLVIHDIDFASYVMGIPDEINSYYLPGKLSKYDYIKAMWTYKSRNVHVSIEGGNTFHIGFPFQAGYIAIFEKASISYTSYKSDLIQVSDDYTCKEIPVGDPGTGYYNEVAYFAECLKNNTQPTECSPISSLQSIKLCYNHILNQAL